MPGLTYAVLGSGAVGGLYGGWLQRAGFKVRFLARSDIHALKNDGLKIISPTGNFNVDPVEVYPNEREIPLSDMVLVAWKTTSNFQLSHILPLVLKPGGIAVVLQNGLHPENEVYAAMPSAEILSGLCFLCCRKNGPNTVEHLEFGTVTLAPYSPNKIQSEMPKALEIVASDFRQASIEIKIESDWKKARWKKLVWNIPFNGLCALYQMDTNKLLENTATSQRLELLANETVAGASMDGIKIEPGFAKLMVDTTRAMRTYEPSMKLDRDLGRPMEIESIYGHVLRRIKSLGGSAKSISELYQELKRV